MVSLVRIFRNDSFGGIFNDKYQLYGTIKLVNSSRRFRCSEICGCFLNSYLSRSGVWHLFPVPLHTFSVIPVIVKEINFGSSSLD